MIKLGLSIEEDEKDEEEEMPALQSQEGAVSSNMEDVD
jgi:hypothetical protein